MVMLQWLISVALLLALSVSVYGQSVPGCEELKNKALEHLKKKPKVDVVKLYKKVEDLTGRLRDYEAQTVAGSESRILREPRTIVDEWRKLVRARYGRDFDTYVVGNNESYDENGPGRLWAYKKKRLRDKIAQEEDIIRRARRSIRSGSDHEYQERQIKFSRRRLWKAAVQLAIMEDYEKDENVGALREELRAAKRRFTEERGRSVEYRRWRSFANARDGDEILRLCKGTARFTDRNAVVYMFVLKDVDGEQLYGYRLAR